MSLIFPKISYVIQNITVCYSYIHCDLKYDVIRYRLNETDSVEKKTYVLYSVMCILHEISRFLLLRKNIKILVHNKYL